MNASNPRRAGLAAMLALATGVALAAPRGVEAFDAAAWQALQAGLKRPAVVVFSATWCANCPEVIDDLGAQLRARKLKADLVSVVMDVAPGEKDAWLLRDAHYSQSDRLFAFAGAANALRYSVDPRWRGVTPYVVLLVPGTAPLAVSGAPSAVQFEAWARAAEAR